MRFIAYNFQKQLCMIELVIFLVALSSVVVCEYKFVFS